MTSPRRLGKALRRALTVGLAGGLWLTVAIPAGAAGTLDAHYTIPTSTGLPINGTQMLAETFTAQATGQLDQVDLPLGGPWNAGGKIYIVPAGTSITDQPGAMTSNSFGTYSGAMSCCSTYRPYPIAPPYHVTLNDHYAVVVVPNPGTSVTWAEVTGGVYSGGKAWKGFQPSFWAPLAMAFDFKTYVTADGALKPTVTRLNGDVPVTEGTAPTNSGTFTDPAGLTVHLTATSGTLSYTPASSGNWTWTGPATDEGPSQTVLITADDGKGTAQATFTTESNKKAPIATIHGATAGVIEGATITLTASAISDSAEDNAGVFTFKWTATEYGTALPDQSGPMFTLKTDDEGSYLISLQATDDGGVSSAIVSVAILGIDSKPNVSGLQVSNPMIITTQQVLTFNGTYADAGSPVDGTYQATWNFGDGSSASAAAPAGLTATHAYANPGTYAATLTVKDDDGTAGAATTSTITVLSPLQAIGRIGTYLQGLGDVKDGQKNSLQVKLNAAADSYQRGDTGAACNQLNAFINEVDADLKGGRLTTGEAGTLTDSARLTQRSMGCFKPLVEFLSGL
jgi:hypothetical protein